jgi:hypothetical protein
VGLMGAAAVLMVVAVGMIVAALGAVSADVAGGTVGGDGEASSRSNGHGLKYSAAQINAIRRPTAPTTTCGVRGAGAPSGTFDATASEMDVWADTDIRASSATSTS